MAKKRKPGFDSQIADEPVNKKPKVQKASATSKKSQALAPATAQKTSKKSSQKQASTPKPLRKRPAVLKLDDKSEEGSDGDNSDGGGPASATLNPASKDDDVKSVEDDSSLPISAGCSFPALPPPPPEFLPTIRGFQPTGTPRPQPVGLKNPGRQNRCYQNAVLTALLHSKRFVAYIQGWHMPREYSPTFSDHTDHVLSGLDQLASIFNDNAVPNTQLELEASNFRKNVTFRKEAHDKKLGILNWMNCSNIERKTLQCDASEFLNWLLQLITAQLELPETALELPFHHLGQVRLSERNCCKSCVWPLRLRRAQLDISVAFPLSPPGLNMDVGSEEYMKALKSRDAISMTAIMSHNLNYPRDVDYKCPRCTKTGMMVDAKLQTAPEILFLYIRRYANIEGPKKDKNGNKIPEAAKWFGQVPLEENIDIAPWLEPHNFGEGTSIRYKLVAVVSHSGSKMSEGHYVSYVRGGTNSKQWYELDDDNVTPVNFAHFSDSDTWTTTKSNWRLRITPFIMIYEKEHQKENITPGRQPMNSVPSTPGDVKPAYWIEQYNADHPNHQVSGPQPRKTKSTTAQDSTTAGNKPANNDSEPLSQTSGDGNKRSKSGGGKASAGDTARTDQEIDEEADSTAKTQQKSQTKSDQHNRGRADSATKTQQKEKSQPNDGTTADPNNVGAQTQSALAGAQDGSVPLSGPSEDQGAGPARLDVRITIGDFAINLPSFVLSQFDSTKRRDMRVDAWIKAPKNQSMNNAIDEDSELSLNVTDVMLDKALGKKGVQWKSRWKSSGAITKQEPEKKKSEPEPKKEKKKKKPDPETKKKAESKKSQSEPSRTQPGRIAKGGK